MSPRQSKRQKALQDLQASQREEFRALAAKQKLERAQVLAEPDQSISLPSPSYEDKYRAIKKYTDLKFKRPNRLSPINKGRITRLFNYINSNIAEGKVFVKATNKRAKLLNSASGTGNLKNLKGGWLSNRVIGPGGKVKWNKNGTFKVINPEFPEQTIVPIDAVAAAKEPGTYIQRLLAPYPDRVRRYIPLQLKGTHKFSTQFKSELIRELVQWFNAYDQETVHDITQWFSGIKIIF